MDIPEKEEVDDEQFPAGSIGIVELEGVSWIMSTISERLRRKAQSQVWIALSLRKIV